MVKHLLTPLRNGMGTMMLLCCLGFGSPVQSAVAEAAEADEQKIVINIASRSLALYKGQEKIRLYPVALGRASTPTPTGYYKVLYKEVNPTWTDPSDPSAVIPSGPSNPLGYRWMQFIGNYGIHGTNRPDSIGHYVSNGCVRMFEKDAEALYDLVKVGTPVEITYNRIVVEKANDGTVVYYIYPDGYRKQSLDVKSVRDWLTAYGVDAFETDEAIAEKINLSDGQPTYIGKPYTITVNGQTLGNKAVKLDDVMFVPVNEIAGSLGLEVKWSPREGIMKTPYGDAVGWEKNKQLYANADDLGALFRLDGKLTKTGQYMLENLPGAAPPLRRENIPVAAPVEALPVSEPAAKPATEAPKITPAAIPEPVEDTARRVNANPIVRPAVTDKNIPDTKADTTKTAGTATVNPVAKPVEKTALEVKPTAEQVAEAKPVVKAKPVVEVKPIAKTEPVTGVKPVAKTEPVAEAKPVAKTEPVTGVKPVAKTEPVAEAKPVAKTEPVIEAKPVTAAAKVPVAEKTATAVKTEIKTEVKPIAKKKRVALAKRQRKYAARPGKNQTSPNAYRQQVG